jgi:regulatory protein
MSARRSTRRPPEGGLLDDAQAVRTAAIALLGRRDFASRELRERLLKQRFDEVAIAAVLAELARDGILDEARYAQNYVTHHADRGQGPVRIVAELRRRGVPDELIEAAIAGGPDWCALARKVCRAKFGPEAPLSWPQRARQARFLQYRGFSSDHIRSATGADPDTGSMDP